MAFGNDVQLFVIRHLLNSVISKTGICGIGFALLYQERTLFHNVFWIIFRKCCGTITIVDLNSSIAGSLYLAADPTAGIKHAGFYIIQHFFYGHLQSSGIWIIRNNNFSCFSGG